MKKIVSFMLAAIMLFTLCACTETPTDTETETVSDIFVSSDFISSLTGTSSTESFVSSDAVSSEHTDKNEISSEPENKPELSPVIDKEESKIQAALNNPGASLDFDIYLVDAPEEGEEWTLIRYNTVDKEIYEELTFGIQDPSKYYIVEFADEYVGNILRISFENGTVCYIDVEHNRFYKASEFKGISKTVSVEKREISVTRSGQYEYWGERHPDYGKVYYSELNISDDILLTVFVKNNKYIFTSYNYETQIFRELFTVSQKPDVKLLGEGVFLFELPSAGQDTKVGGLYMCDANEGVRYKITTEGRRISLGNKYIDATPDFIEELMKKAYNGDVAHHDGIIWWCVKDTVERNVVYMCAYDNRTGEFKRSKYTHVKIKEKDNFFGIEDAVGIKLYSSDIISGYESYGYEAEGTLLVCDRYRYYYDSQGRPNIYQCTKEVKEIYPIPRGEEFLVNVKLGTNKQAWETVTVSHKEEWKPDGEVPVYNRKVLLNPNVTVGNDVWLLESHDREGYENDTYHLYRYDLITGKIYLTGIITPELCEEDSWSMNEVRKLSIKGTSSDGGTYVEVVTNELTYDVGPLYLDLKNGRFISYSTYFSLVTEEKAVDRDFIRTYFDNPVVQDGIIEVPAEYKDYGKANCVYEIPGKNEVLILYGHSLWSDEEVILVKYDYDTNTFKEILKERCYSVARDFNEEYLVITFGTPTESETPPEDSRAYLYEYATEDIVRLSAADMDATDFTHQSWWFDNDYAAQYHNGKIWWREQTRVTTDEGRSLVTTIHIYDPESDTDKKYLTVTVENFAYDRYGFAKWDFVSDGVIVKTMTDDRLKTLVGELYYCTDSEKPVCISEKTLYYFVCEEQGYVMYSEEREDGSFEWKYYDL